MSLHILVTGAGGFVGRRLIARLKAHGHRTEIFPHDLTQPFSLDGSFDVVVHLAAYNITSVGERNEAFYAAVNVEGTKRLLETVHAKRFFYLSTVKVYKNEGKPLIEESPLGPVGGYEQSKLKAEEICRQLIPQDSLVILRSVNVLGWGQAPKAVLPVFFEKARANQPLDIMGSAQTPMQFVYVEDLIDAIEAVMERQVSGVFNVAGDETVTLEQLARRIIAITQSSSVVHANANAPKGIFSPVVAAKAHQQLGWKAKTDLDRILKFYAESKS